MKVYLHNEGAVEKSHKEDFEAEIECPHCGETRLNGKAILAFVVFEKGIREENLLHQNKPKAAAWWLYNACAVAVYFCTSCHQASVVWNQA